jgi:tRNA A37 methylthiotransferase MiaB
MRRFGDPERFLGLLGLIRSHDPYAGARSNVIVGFPGETEADLTELEEFLVAARLDVVGVFGYSDEDGTEAETYGDKLAEDVVAERVSRFTALIEELNLQRAEERIGETVDVLVESVPTGAEDDEELSVVGRAAHQGPDVDGVTMLDPAHLPDVAVGDIVRAVITGTEGIDLLAAPC